MNFNYYLPVNLIFGCGVIETAGNVAKKYGSKALVVTGKASTKKTGLLDKIITILKKSEISSVVFDEVEPNPLTTTAHKAAEIIKAQNCDMVIGVGGGSIMDCAKAAAFIACNDGDINDYIFNKKTSEKALPVILIPTTCGTGSEGNGFAVLTNPENGDKKSLRCNAIVPKSSIIDPDCMKTMPKHILASVGFDALCHNIEAYTSKIAQPFTDILSLYAIKLISDDLVNVYNDPDYAEGWNNITLASTIGGMVINTAGVTLAHGMEHPVSGLKNVVHGKGLAALTPVVTEASYVGNTAKYTQIAKTMGGNEAADCPRIIRKLLKAIDLECTLSELGIQEKDIPWLTENCIKVSSANIANNPVVFSYEEIVELYKKSL